jgi:predicted dinucleotide-binding enzyme
VPATSTAAVAAAGEVVGCQDEKTGAGVEIAVLAVRDGLCMCPENLRTKTSIVVSCVVHISIVESAQVTRRTSSNVVSPRLAFVMPACRIVTILFLTAIRFTAASVGVVRRVSRTTWSIARTSKMPSRPR